MRAPLFFSILMGFIALTASFAGEAWAQPGYGPGGIQPLDRLLPGIRRAHPGEFYDADGPNWGPNGNPHYHLKWLTPDGRVIWFDADARSGRVLHTSPGRDSFDAPRGYGRAYPDARDGGRNYAPQNFNRGSGYARPYGGWRGDDDRGHWRR